MKNREADSERVATAESEQTASDSRSLQTRLRQDWTGVEPDDEAQREELKECLVESWLGILRRVNEALCRLEAMESPIESSAINTEVENAGKTLAVEFRLLDFPHYRLPQPMSLGRRCERLARRVADAHWHEPEKIHVVVLGAECVDESLLDLDNGSED